MTINQKGFSPLVILPLLLLFSIAGIVFGVYLLKNKIPQIQAPATSTTVENNPSATSSAVVSDWVQELNLEEGPSLNFFKLENDKLQKLYSHKDTASNMEVPNTSPVLDNSGKIYFSDDSRVYRYLIDEKRSDQMYKLNNTNLKISKIAVKANTLYISILPKEGIVSSNNEHKQGFVDEVNLDTGALRTIGPVSYVLYGGVDYVGKTRQGWDIISSIGEDGCGGFGDVYTLANSVSKKTVSVGTGCTLESRLLGEYDGKLVLFSITDTPFVPEGFAEHVDKLYLLDPDDLQKQEIFDLKEISGQVKGYYFDFQTGKVYFRLSDNFRVYDLKTEAIQKINFSEQVDLGSSLEHYFFEEKLFYISSDYPSSVNKVLKIFDLKTNQTKQINWKVLPNVTVLTKVIGIHKDSPVISVYVYKNQL